MNYKNIFNLFLFSLIPHLYSSSLLPSACVVSIHAHARPQLPIGELVFDFADWPKMNNGMSYAKTLVVKKDGKIYFVTSNHVTSHPDAMLADLQNSTGLAVTMKDVKWFGVLEVDSRNNSLVKAQTLDYFPTKVDFLPV